MVLVTASSASSNSRVANVLLASPAPGTALGRGFNAVPARMGMTWGVGNKLMTFPTQTPRAAAGPTAGINTDMHEVTWETTLYQPVFRKLVNESWQIFRAVQKAAKDQEGSLE